MHKTIINHKSLGPIALVIIDGWGINKKYPGNAIELAQTPVMDKILKNYPHALLHASGKYVGLPSDQIGNSEAGHLNIGAGRVVEQDAVKIGKAINQGSFFRNPIFVNMINHVKEHSSSLHIMGLLSDGQSAHSDPDHIFALIALTRMNNVKNVYLHLFLDGRDSSTHGGLKLIEALERGMKNEKIATVMGRFYAMDRKKSWKSTEEAYNCLILGEGLRSKSPQAAITESYNRGETDEYVPPYVITKDNKTIATIKDNDAIIFFNLRSDRARQITKALVQKDFEKENKGSFKRKKILNNTFFVAMTNFGPDLGNVFTAYPNEPLADTLPMLLSSYRQIYITEAEKYAHMTYFINGGYPDPVANEARIRIPSPDVKYYDQTPHMSVSKVTNKAIQSLGSFDFIAMNFSSPDMIGHTGNLKATIKAIEFVDMCIGKLQKEVLKKNGILIITADHGNAEIKIDPDTKEISTRHTKSLVPFIIVSKKKIKMKKIIGSLKDIAPTILDLFHINKPKIYTGKSFIIH